MLSSSKFEYPTLKDLAPIVHKSVEKYLEGKKTLSEDQSYQLGFNVMRVVYSYIYDIQAHKYNDVSRAKDLLTDFINCFETYDESIDVVEPLTRDSIEQLARLRGIRLKAKDYIAK